MLCFTQQQEQEQEQEQEEEEEEEEEEPSSKAGDKAADTTVASRNHLDIVLTSFLELWRQKIALLLLDPNFPY